MNQKTEKKLNDDDFEAKQRKIIDIREKAVSEICTISQQRDDIVKKRAIASMVMANARAEFGSLRTEWAQDIFQNEAHPFLIDGEIESAVRSMKRALP